MNDFYNVVGKKERTITFGLVIDEVRRLSDVYEVHGLVLDIKTKIAHEITLKRLLNGTFNHRPVWMIIEKKNLYGRKIYDIYII